MVEVYWIKHKEHTDVFSQGYVGVSSVGAENRFKQHLSQKHTKRYRGSHLSRALELYKDDIEMCVLCVCNKEYALWLENKLRPVSRIGWNMVEGGGLPPNHKGFTRSKETLEKMSKARKGVRRPDHIVEKMRGRRLSDEQKQQISEKLKGRKLSDEHCKSMSDRIKETPFYIRNAQRGKLSSAHFIADMFYEMFLDGVKVSRPLAAKYGVTRQVLKTLWSKFNDGWVPKKDEQWVSFVSNYSYPESNHISLTSDNVAGSDNSVSNSENV